MASMEQVGLQMPTWTELLLAVYLWYVVMCAEFYRGIVAVVYIARIPFAPLLYALAKYTCVFQVGPSYGRRMMTGFLAAQGFRCGEVRIGRSLSRVAPAHHNQRATVTYRQTNPLPYSADYFGQKVLY